MNEEDLRDCFAMFAMLGLIIKYGGDFTPQDAWANADAMIEARNPPDEEGIAVIKKRKYVRKN